MNADGGSEAAVTARRRIGWMKFRKCGAILSRGRFILKMKGRVYRNCVRPSMLFGRESWCLKEYEMEILKSLLKGQCVL